MKNKTWNVLIFAPIAILLTIFLIGGLYLTSKKPIEQPKDVEKIPHEFVIPDDGDGKG